MNFSHVQLVILLITLSAHCSCLSMETKPQCAVEIVDHNNAQSIKTFIDNEPSIIGVFGATPRYSAFKHYTKTFQKDCTALLDQYKKDKRLKGVAGSTKEIVKSLEKEIDLAKFNSFIETNDHAKIDLFFSAGYEDSTLEENFSTLINATQSCFAKKNSSHKPAYLAHLLMPSYFVDAPELKNNEHAAEQLHTFLIKSALFYRTCYQNAVPSDSFKPIIVIPHIEHFTQAVNGQQLDKLEINLSVVQKDLINMLPAQHEIMLINQNKDELLPMINELQKKVPHQIGGAYLPITNKRGIPSTIFNSYLIKAENKQHTYQQSPLFTQNVVSFAQSRKDSINE